MTEETDATHPGFTITCNACGSARVELHSDLGFSAESGSWGGVYLTCADCEATTEVVSS